MSENAQVFPPSEEFAAQANATAELYDEAQRRGDEFWAEQARALLHWDTEFTSPPRPSPSGSRTGA